MAKRAVQFASCRSGKRAISAPSTRLSVALFLSEKVNSKLFLPCEHEIEFAAGSAPCARLSPEADRTAISADTPQAALLTRDGNCFDDFEVILGTINTLADMSQFKLARLGKNANGAFFRLLF
ncbi:hypothetical protein MAUB1S_10092 [Mycolicibacterium aubagnense]